ncbi:MAG: hypothetical protein HW402_837 [Dehalococcoidales bacterium]|nr:hypothetical protein [Dehalococcoidales bacterium]
MNGTKTIAAKGLEHGEREELIFSSIEALKDGEALQLVVEFNPLPLVYMLNAQKEFQVSYEKEGPDEWILNITKTVSEADKKAQFRELLHELGKGEVSSETREKARGLLQSVDAKTLGLLEQELIREGISHDEIRHSLCDIHLGVMKDSLVAKRIDVPAPHPVHTFMAEHTVIMDNLRELGTLVEKLKGITSFEGMGTDLGKLEEVAHLLTEAESHHQREEEVLFPKLEQHDIAEPPAIMKMEHVEFRKKKKELYQLAQNARDYDFNEFKEKVTEAGKYLSLELASHIFKEDNILYQMALQVLSPAEWEEVKKECDRVGYCCFTPEDQVREKEVVALDLRPLPAFERHDRIFEMWDALAPGQTLRITNDHDPKPLHYQFEAEYKGLYEWEYEQKGPKDWVVKLKKI